MILIQTAQMLNTPEIQAKPRLMDVIACHQFVMETSWSVVDKAMQLVGGAGLFRSSPPEQLYRDARAGILHQPFAVYDGLGWMGNLAFGRRLMSCHGGNRSYIGDQIRFGTHTHSPPSPRNCGR